MTHTVKWCDVQADDWDDVPDDPPATTPVVADEEAVTLEPTPDGGGELRERATGAWLSSSRVDLLADSFECH